MKTVPVRPDLRLYVVSPAGLVVQHYQNFCKKKAAFCFCQCLFDISSNSTDVGERQDTILPDKDRRQSDNVRLQAPHWVNEATAAVHTFDRVASTSTPAPPHSPLLLHMREQKSAPAVSQF